jgi:hypothetical protein
VFCHFNRTIYFAVSERLKKAARFVRYANEKSTLHIEAGTHQGVAMPQTFGLTNSYRSADHPCICRSP